MTSIDNFDQLDIRVGTVVEVQEFVEAQRPAYKLKIDFGPELGIKKSSAQITKRYRMADLIDEQVVAIVNLPPKQIANFLSEVLVLGIYDRDGIVLLRPDKKVNNGTKIG